MRFVNRFLSLLLLLACSLVGRAASPAYNTSTGVVSPTQFLKLDAAELKVMGVDVLTTAPNIYTTDGTLGGDRTVNGGGNDLTFTNMPLFQLVNGGDSLSLFFDNGPEIYGDGPNPDEYFDLKSRWLIMGGGALGLYPNETSGGNYYFGTVDTIEGGDLLSVQNNGTNIFTIDYLGNITANNINIPGDQTANNLTITNVLTVKGSIRADTLIVTNNVTFYNNTYSSNFYAFTGVVTNDFTVLGTATVPTVSAGDNDTSAASTAFVQTAVTATQSGTHASPSTTNPLAPTWNGPLHTVWYGATGEIDLPAAASYTGKALLIYNTGAFTVTVDPNGSEVIVRDGTVQTGGVSMTLSSGAGNYVAMFCDGARWVTLGYKGTLAEGS